MFLPSSLAAVTIFVWSVSFSPACTAMVRTSWRARTRSSLDVTASVSFLAKILRAHRALRRRSQNVHARLHIQRRANARQRKTQFHERDRYCGAHPNYHGLGVENARRRRDVAEHAADE